MDGIEKLKEKGNKISRRNTEQEEGGGPFFFLLLVGWVTDLLSFAF